MTCFLQNLRVKTLNNLPKCSCSRSFCPGLGAELSCFHLQPLTSLLAPGVSPRWKHILTVCSALQGASPGYVLSQGPAKGSASFKYWELSRSTEWDPSLCHEFLICGAKIISWTRFWTVVVCWFWFGWFVFFLKFTAASNPDKLAGSIQCYIYTFLLACF